MSFLPKIVALGVLFILSFQSCSLYIPNRINVVNIEQKGDVFLYAGVGLLSLDVQADFALSNNLYLGASGFGTYITGEDGLAAQKNFFLGGDVGYQLRKKNLSHIFSTTHGWGRGESYDEYSGQIGLSYEYYKGDYYRGSVQYTFLIDHEIFEPYLNLRCSFVNAYNYTSHKFPEGNSAEKYYLEPAFGFYLGSDQIKFCYQLGISLTNDTENLPFQQRPYFGSIGVLFKL